MVVLDPNTFVRLRAPRPVNRYAFVRDLCVGKRVLDLGAYDETEVDKPQSQSWRWLHAEIAGVASEVLGVDASAALRGTGGVQTRVGTRIVYGTVEELDEIVAQFQPDIVVAGELIEHTQDTLGWISRLAELLPGAEFVATTPNTTWLLNVLLALVNRESAHPDHIHVYSYRTLLTLAQRVPISGATVTPYYFNRAVAQHRRRLLRPAVAAFDLLLLRPLQYLFPLLGRGLILTGRLGRSDSPPPHATASGAGIPAVRLEPESTVRGGT